MAKSSTTLWAEIRARQPNDPTGLTQGFTRRALSTLHRCNSLESLTAMQSICDVMLVEYIAVNTGADPASRTALMALMANDTTGITQGFKAEVTKVWHEVRTHSVPDDAPVMFEAVLFTLDLEIAAKIAAL